MKQKIGLSNQMPGVVNQRKHDQQSSSVKMTRFVTRRKLRNEVDKVENVKYPHLNQNVKLEDDQNVYMHKGHTIVNAKVHGSNNQKKQKKRKLSEAMNQKRGLDRKPGRKNTKSLTLKKPKDETDNADVKGSPNDMVLDLEYLHPYQNVKLEDDHYVDIHKGHTVVNDKVYGLDDQNKQKRRKLSKATNQKIGLPDQIPGVENKCKRDLQYTSVMKTTGLILRKLKNESDKADAKGSPNDNVSDLEYLHPYQNVKLEDDHYVDMHKGHNVVNERISGVNHQKKQNQRGLSRTSKQKVGLSYEMPAVENQYKHDAQPTSVKKTKSLTLRKSRNESEKVETVKCLSSEFRNVKAPKGFMAYTHKGHTVLNEEIYAENDKEKELENENSSDVEIIEKNSFHKYGEGSLNTVASTEDLKYINEDSFQNLCDDDHYDYMHKSHAVVNEEISGVNNLVKEGEDEIGSDVEILDSAAYLTHGILSSFVPSKRFHKSMNDDDFQHLGRSSASDEFRKRVLDVLTKPYDKEEYNRLQEAIQAGSYLGYYPDLGRKLKKYRYKHGKRLTIFRGFFFWLQNLTQEGAFKPWNDRDCLAVEL